MTRGARTSADRGLSSVGVGLVWSGSTSTPEQHDPYPRPPKVPAPEGTGPFRPSSRWWTLTKLNGCEHRIVGGEDQDQPARKPRRHRPRERPGTAQAQAAAHSPPSSLSARRGRVHLRIRGAAGDGSTVPCGATFTETWTIRNSGHVAWHGRRLRRIGPTTGPWTLTSECFTQVPDTEPGETVSISVQVRTPQMETAAVAQCVRLPERLWTQAADDGAKPTRGASRRCPVRA